MRERIEDLGNRLKEPNRLSRFRQWIRAHRPLDYLIEGGPLQRFIAAIVLLGIAFTVSWIIAGIFAQNTGQQIMLFTGLMSGLLTFGLIWIYLSIAESERTQAQFVEKQTRLQEDIQDLQKDQVEIMGAEFEPVIEINDLTTGVWDPTSVPFPMRDGHPKEGDCLKLEVSNLSSAIATNCHFRIVIDYLGGVGGAVANKSVPLLRERRDSWTSKPGAILKDKEESVELTTVAGLGFPPKGPDVTFPFSYCVESLIEMGNVPKIRVGTAVTYEDRAGNTHIVGIEGMELDNFEDMELTYGNIRSVGKEIPYDAISDGLLKQGIRAIPPEYYF